MLALLMLVKITTTNVPGGWIVRNDRRQRGATDPAYFIVDDGNSVRIAFQLGVVERTQSLFSRSVGFGPQSPSPKPDREAPGD